MHFPSNSHLKWVVLDQRSSSLSVHRCEARPAMWGQRATQRPIDLRPQTEELLRAMDTQRPNHLGGFLDFIERPQLGQQVGLKPRAVSESSSESSRLQRHTFEIRVAVRGCSASRTSRRRGSIHSTVDRRCVGLRGTWRERHRRGGGWRSGKGHAKDEMPSIPGTRNG